MTSSFSAAISNFKPNLKLFKLYKNCIILRGYLLSIVKYVYVSLDIKKKSIQVGPSSMEFEVTRKRIACDSMNVDFRKQIPSLKPKPV